METELFFDVDMQNRLYWWKEHDEWPGLEPVNMVDYANKLLADMARAQCTK